MEMEHDSDNEKVKYFIAKSHCVRCSIFPHLLSNENNIFLFTFFPNPAGQKIIVRTEEVCIVGFVLILWVGAIALFFNRWGKIRMLEPYQPKFQQQHRSSCPLVDLDSLKSHPVIEFLLYEKIFENKMFVSIFQRPSVSRMSMGMAVPIQMPPCQFSAYNYNTTLYSHGKRSRYLLYFK